MAAGTLQVRLTAALNGPGWEFTAMVWSRLRIGDRRGSFGARHRGSMTRYIVLELAEFLAELQKAEAQGVRARGAEPVTVHPIMMMVNKVLEQVVAGDADAASEIAGFRRILAKHSFTEKWEQFRKRYLGE